MIVKQRPLKQRQTFQFESSVNSYDSQTWTSECHLVRKFESSVNSYDSQTFLGTLYNKKEFESSVNSYDSQTRRTQ